MREDTMRDYAQQAGFIDFEVAPIENDFWRFYECSDLFCSAAAACIRGSRHMSCVARGMEAPV